MELQLTELVIYALTRHSGASWAMVKQRMDAAGVARKGRWRSLSSVRRYEKRTMVLQEWQGYSSQQKAFFTTCAEAVSRVMAGEQLAPRLPW